jgi:hypothetical protein
MPSGMTPYNLGEESISYAEESAAFPLEYI